MTDSFELALVVIMAALAEEHLEDFKLAGRLSPDSYLGYEARMSTMTKLVDEGYVLLSDGRLKLGTPHNSTWLVAGLEAGEPNSWKIADAYSNSEVKYEVDSALLRKIGLEGEQFVLEALRQELPDELWVEIDHISLRDDSAGYDLSFLSPEGKRKHLEIKTTTRPDENFPFFLTRNEYEKSMVTVDWWIVFVRKQRGVFSVFGHLDSKSLAGNLPIDTNSDFQWETTRCRLSSDDVYAGLPLQR